VLRDAPLLAAALAADLAEVVPGGGVVGQHGLDQVVQL
jgi:hypothetical protein